MAARLRFLTVPAALLMASAVFASPAMAATTWYASPTGAGSTCSQASPCELKKAVEDAQGGDSVVLLPGVYTLSSNLQITRSISFGGESETNTTIQTIGGASIEVNEVANATVHDLRVDTTQPFELKSGSAERIFVDYAGTSVGRSACSLDPGASLLDSVCWAHGGAVLADAIFSESVSFSAEPITLRNVTAIAEAPGEDGIFAEVESSTANLTISATNVIVRGGDYDIGASAGGGTSSASVILTHSNYAKVDGAHSGVTITTPGTNGNQTAPPAFVDGAAGNFAEATGSPTIDAGLNEAANGATALAGETRVLPAVCGGPAVTDIGAYEFVPSGCSSSTSTTTTTVPAQPAAPSNKITLGKLKRNPKNGTATLLVSVPDAGTLTLSGKGLKKVSRRSGGAARLKLPITPVGKAKRKLAGLGSAKFTLKLSFVPVGGSAGSSAKSVKLTERLH